MNLAKELNDYFETSNCPYESWHDIARVLARFLSSKGYSPIRCAQPERTGLGTSMYVMEFRVKETDEIKWLAYDDEAGIYEIYATKPIPGDFS